MGDETFHPTIRLIFEKTFWTNGESSNERLKIGTIHPPGATKRETSVIHVNRTAALLDLVNGLLTMFPFVMVTYLLPLGDAGTHKQINQWANWPIFTCLSFLISCNRHCRHSHPHSHLKYSNILVVVVKTFCISIHYRSVSANKPNSPYSQPSVKQQHLLLWMWRYGGMKNALGWCCSLQIGTEYFLLHFNLFTKSGKIEWNRR